MSEEYDKIKKEANDIHLQLIHIKQELLNKKFELEKLLKQNERLTKINNELELQCRKKWNEKETKHFADFIKKVNETIIKVHNEQIKKKRVYY